MRRCEEESGFESERKRETGIEIGGKVRESSGGGAERKSGGEAEVREGESAGHMGKQGQRQCQR